MKVRAHAARDWSFACSGDLSGGSIALPPSGEPERVHFGPLFIDRTSMKVAVNGAPVKIPQRQFELLSLLAAEPDHARSRPEIGVALGGSKYPLADRTVYNLAGRLRTRLSRAGAEGFVVTCFGIGYRLW